MGARLVLCKKLNVLAVAFRGMRTSMRSAPFRHAPTDQPTQTEGELVDFRLGDLKKQRKGSAVDLDKSTLRAWRSKHDAKKQRASVTSTGQTEEQQESPTASAGGQSSGTKRMRSSLEGWVKTIVNGVTL
ncbi:hypothetical protein RI054_35g135550 [Pseudoscourfieldia marina]